jgi:hypothetical protein
MAALDQFRTLTARVRSYLHQHPDVLPGRVLVKVADAGGLEAYAVTLGVQDDPHLFTYLCVFYLECHRLCDMGRAWVPYQPPP